MVKNLTLIILTLVVTGCDGIFGVSNYSGPAPSSIQAKENDLFITSYIPSTSKVFIKNDEYEIVEAWSSYRFKSKNNIEKNPELCDIIIRLKNVDTGETTLPVEITSQYSSYFKVKHGDENMSYGIENDNIDITLHPKALPKIEEFSISFKGKVDWVEVNFKKRQ